MPVIHETAYPSLKEGVTPAELAEVYTPTAEELALAMRTSTRSGARLGFLVLLKFAEVTRVENVDEPSGLRETV